MNCRALIATRDWAATPLGPIERWPASLRATVANILHTRQPMLLFWGPELIQFYNDSFVPSFGQGKHPTALGQRARECWDDAWPVVGAQIEAVMARGEPAWFENALVPIFRNGRMEEVFWTYSYSPAYDDHEQIFGTLVIVTEMTGRVVAARRLAALSHVTLALASATTYEAAFGVLVELVDKWPSDLPFAFVQSPRGVEHSAGISAEHAAGLGLLTSPRGVVVLAGAQPGAVWPEPVPAAVTANAGTRGHIVAFGASPRLPLDDAYRSFLAQLVDQLASALARIDNTVAAQAVQRQRDNLLLHAPVATALMTGPRHVYELANALYCKIVGRDPTGQAYVDAFPELRDTPLPGILDRVYQTGEPYVVSEMRVPLDRSGSGVVEDCYFKFNLEALRDESDRVYGMMAIAVDITDQVNARLAIERANRTKDDFLAMLGHELRNPLAPIVTALELMNAKDASAPRAPERAVVERHVKHMVRLVDDLLDVSKITRGALVLDKHPVELAGVIAAAIETSAHLIEQRRHRIEVEVAPGVCVDGDESRLVQIVANLMTNAARYTPPGGLIHVAVTATATDATIAVTDTGTGIAPDLLPRIFDSFVQGARSTDRAEGGLGLGLAIVKNLVALHGGKVTASSPGLGRGSTFVVRLPLATSAPQATRPVAPRAAGTKRILLVDDNADAADMLGEVVRMHGHDVTIAHDPRTALDLLSELQPEIALLDIGLPGMDGYELATRVIAKVPACRLIALTGYGQDTDRDRATRAGFAAHLVKPVDLDKLLRLLA